LIISKHSIPLMYLLFTYLLIAPHLIHGNQIQPKADCCQPYFAETLTHRPLYLQNALLAERSICFELLTIPCSIECYLKKLDFSTVLKSQLLSNLLCIVVWHTVKCCISNFVLYAKSQTVFRSFICRTANLCQATC
jgi:hypothetical protein